MNRPRYLPWLAPALRRVALLSVLWMILTKGDLDTLPFALPAVLVAAGISLRLTSPGEMSWRLGSVATLVGVFAVQSLRGGVDVARRALNPRLPIAPGFIRYHIRLPEGRGRVLFANGVSLTPGTLSVRIHDDELLIHVLHRSAGVDRSIRRLEDRIAEAIGAALTS